MPETQNQMAHASPAEALIAAYLSLGARLREAESQAWLARLIRKLKLIHVACQRMPAVTKEHLDFMAATASRATRQGGACGVPMTAMSYGETIDLLDTLRQLKENRVSVIDPACLAFGRLREDAIFELAMDTLVRAATSSGLVQHKDVAVVCCCHSASNPHTLEIILRDRRALDYRILVLETEPLGSPFMVRQTESAATSMTRLMPVMET